MAANTPVAMSPARTDDVMASVDNVGTTKKLIIADISCDDSWISLPVTEAVSLPNWR
jgi:hypothetical protein